MDSYNNHECYQYDNGIFSPLSTNVITEIGVTFTVNGEAWLSTLCTPVYLEAMAVGFLFNEGLIKSRDEIADVRVCAEKTNIDIWTTHRIAKPTVWRKTSGCTGGVTSLISELSIDQYSHSSSNGVVLTPEEISELIAALLHHQELYRASGGVHTSLLTDGKENWISAEDIGRHNSLDKLAGRLLLENIKLEHRVLLTTGRISSEMLQKSARMKASVVISRTSPSTLSIELADHFGITLIGYARRNRFNIYTHPKRILGLAADTIRAKAERENSKL